MNACIAAYIYIYWSSTALLQPGRWKACATAIAVLHHGNSDNSDNRPHVRMPVICGVCILQFFQKSLRYVAQTLDGILLAERNARLGWTCSRPCSRGGFRFAFDSRRHSLVALFVDDLVHSRLVV